MGTHFSDSHAEEWPILREPEPANLTEVGVWSTRLRRRPVRASPGWLAAWVHPLYHPAYSAGVHLGEHPRRHSPRSPRTPFAGNPKSVLLRAPCSQPNGQSFGRTGNHAPTASPDSPWSLRGKRGGAPTAMREPGTSTPSREPRTSWKIPPALRNEPTANSRQLSASCRPSQDFVATQAQAQASSRKPTASPSASTSRLTASAFRPSDHFSPPLL